MRKRDQDNRNKAAKIEPTVIQLVVTFNQAIFLIAWAHRFANNNCKPIVWEWFIIYFALHSLAFNENVERNVNGSEKGILLVFFRRFITFGNKSRFGWRNKTMILL